MTMTRLRVTAVAVFAIAGMLGTAACSTSTPGKGQLAVPKGPLPSISQGSTGSAPTGGPTLGGVGSGKGDPAFCAKIVESMGKLSGLAGDAGDMTKLRESLVRLTAFYKDLENAAPAELKDPLAHMVSAMDAAATALANPSSADAMQKVGDLMTKLPEDAAKVSAYIATACTGS